MFLFSIIFYYNTCISTNTYNDILYNLNIEYSQITNEEIENIKNYIENKNYNKNEVDKTVCKAVIIFKNFLSGFEECKSYEKNIQPAFYEEDTDVGCFGKKSKCCIKNRKKGKCSNIFCYNYYVSS